ncbi:MAG: TadE family protein [Acidimicrobiales bacterium]
MIEAAIVTPAFFALLFGILEFGLLFRSVLATNNGAAEAARAAAVSGARPEADYFILRSVQHGIGALSLDQLEYVVVFRADGPESTMPPACANGSIAAPAGDPTAPACNRYVRADFYKELDDPVSGEDTGNFRCGPTSIDRYWCPTDRDNTLAGGTDYVGVTVKTRHDFITGILPGGKDLGQTMITRLEPVE